MNWTKTIIDYNGYPIKAYTNKSQTRTILFFLFGRYTSFSSDVNSLDLAIMIIFHKYSDDYTIPSISTYEAYKNSLEDTIPIIDIKKVA